MKKFFFVCWWLLFFPILSFAADPLPVDQAFSFSAHVIDKNTVQADWKIAPGYYLYREQVKFSLPPTTPARLGAVDLPPGIPKQDEILGKYQVYENALTVIVPIFGPQSGQLELQVNYQGCASSGFCYPPVSKRIALVFTPNTAQTTSIRTDQVQKDSTVAQQDTVQQLLTAHHWLFIIASFFGFGFLLAFTPCVLPMLPILAGIIVGQGSTLTTKRAFSLSLSYVLGVAITYALAGVLAALAGNYVQAVLQNPWVIGAFSLVFVLLALSLFGFYELRLPGQLQEGMTNLSNRQRGGTYLGTFIMGCLSLLIVSPCITAPLIGALTYIGNTGDTLLGGIALFTMGLGMGVPLLIVGTTGGKYLPKAGAWMNAVKAFFGVLLLAAAVWLLQRIISAQWSMILWGTLAIISAIYLGAFTAMELQGWRNFWRGLGILLFIYGILIFVGAFQGGTDPLKPFAKITSYTAMQPLPFRAIKSSEDLRQALINAQTEGKPVMLDFYADWCISCKQMERYTFAAPAVQTALQSFILLRADVTANDAVDRELEKQFNVIAPPTILFFDKKGKELTNQRIVGEMNATEFLEHLQSLF